MVSRGKDPVVVLGQHRQIGRRYLELLADRSFALSIRTMAKLLNGTRQRFSGFSQPRQCGDDVFLMFVTGGPPVRDGGGMPQRIIVSSRPSPVFALREPDSQEIRPASAAGCRYTG
jgi:hypothetical protein